MKHMSEEKKEELEAEFRQTVGRFTQWIVDDPNVQAVVNEGAKAVSGTQDWSPEDFEKQESSLEYEHFWLSIGEHSTFLVAALLRYRLARNTNQGAVVGINSPSSLSVFNDLERELAQAEYIDGHCTKYAMYWHEAHTETTIDDPTVWDIRHIKDVEGRRRAQLAREFRRTQVLAATAASLVGCSIK